MKLLQSRFSAVAVLLAVVGFFVATTNAQLAPLPSKWPSNNFELGMANQPSPGPSEVVALCPECAFRYTYINGGFTTGWTSWNSPPGKYATYYLQASNESSITTVFTYYQMLQSGSSAGDEQTTDMAHLNDGTLMKKYFDDFKLLMQKCNTDTPTGTPVIVHLEPDLWGHIQQTCTTVDDATTRSAAVASSGHADVQGYANTAAGYAQALRHIRDLYAPNVLLAFHISIWGTGIDIYVSQSSNTDTITLANKIVAFYTSLGANFDLLFTEFSDRDHGYNNRPFATVDFQRLALFVKTVSEATRKRVVMWQIPFGNTKMRTCNNQANHYQDNRIETFFDNPDDRTMLNTYIDAGVIAFLFGAGQGDQTSPADSAGDGITNPAAINGNNVVSTVVDDDGGYWGIKSKAYYTKGAAPIAAGSDGAADGGDGSDGGSSDGGSASALGNWLSLLA